jgi:hypothetical protein
MSSSVVSDGGGGGIYRGGTGEETGDQESVGGRARACSSSCWFHQSMPSVTPSFASSG